MTVVEDRKRKFSEAQARYRERADGRVTRRAPKEDNVTNLSLDITSEGLLKRAEATLDAAKELLEVAMELVAEAKKK